MKNLSLLLQLLAWPSSSLCLKKEEEAAKNDAFVRKERQRAAGREASAEKKKYLSVYVVRLRWRRRVAFSLTKVRPVGSNVHISVMHTLRMTSQLHTTMPAKNFRALTSLRNHSGARRGFRVSLT